MLYYWLFLCLWLDEIQIHLCLFLFVWLLLIFVWVFFCENDRLNCRLRRWFRILCKCLLWVIFVFVFVCLNFGDFLMKLRFLCEKNRFLDCCLKNDVNIVFCRVLNFRCWNFCLILLCFRCWNCCYCFFLQWWCYFQFRLNRLNLLMKRFRLCLFLNVLIIVCLLIHRVFLILVDRFLDVCLILLNNFVLLILFFRVFFVFLRFLKCFRLDLLRWRMNFCRFFFSSIVGRFLNMFWIDFDL